MTLQALTKHVMDAQVAVAEADQLIARGHYPSETDGTYISTLFEQAQTLRDEAMRLEILGGMNLSEIARKYRTNEDEVQKVLGKKYMVSDSINRAGNTLLELAPLAFTDVRGERIVEKMRQKIASGERPGITVIGPFVTIRFGGVENGLQSVSMIVISVVDSSVEDNQG